MTILREIRPDQVIAIEALADQLRVNWRMAIAFDNKLDATAPMLHETLEDVRKRILIRVVELMLGSPEPWTQLAQAETIAEEIVRHGFGNLYAELVPDVSSGETARLIGECPIGWEIRGGAHV
jgi:hypothetical protein